MRLLLSFILIFILSACGDDKSGSSKKEPSTDPEITEKVFPYGTYQTTCYSFGVYSNVPAYNDMGVIQVEEYNYNTKQFIQYAYAFDKADNNLCAIPLFKLAYSFSFNDITYDKDEELYKVELHFIKATATPGSSTLADSWNESSYMGINTWVDRVERDITGKNADGSSFIPDPITYKIINLTNGNTQLIQNDSVNKYPDSLDYSLIFFKAQ